MNILAIETTGDFYSIALYCADEECYFFQALQPQTQARNLLNSVQAGLVTARMVITEIEALAVCVGPGSFTGVRLGLAAVQGIALVRNLPIIGVDVFSALFVAMEPQANAILATVPAGRSKFYCQRIKGDGDSLAPFIASEEEIKSIYKAEQIIGVLGTETLLINARQIAKCAWQRLQGGDILPPKPIYVGGNF